MSQEFEDIVLEYNDNNEIVYIVDEYNLRGFRVKNIKSSHDLEKAIESIKSTRTEKKNSISCWIKKINNYAKKCPPKKVSNLLITIYIISILINFYCLFLYPELMDIKVDSFFFHELSPKNVIYGLIIFFTGLILIHEGSHIFVSLMQNIKVSKLGFRIKYGFIPMLYVRIYPTSYNKKKMNIAMAGLVADQILLCIYINIFIWTRGQTVLISLILQFILLIFNYNPLFPSDFTQTILAKHDMLNFRMEAFRFFKSIFKLKRFSINKINLIYLLYSCLFLVFLILMFINMISIITGVIKGEI